MLVETIAASLGSAVHRAGLVADLERTFTTTLSALMSTVEAKDDYTASHEEDVAGLAERVALRMGLRPRAPRDVRYAALLHDVGKVAVPSEILLKPGPLTETSGSRCAATPPSAASSSRRIDAFAHLAPAVRASHERWDGDGYPDGIAGEEIPLAARIIAACDTYDAIVTDRPYRPARTPAQARAELRRVAGSPARRARGRGTARRARRRGSALTQTPAAWPSASRICLSSRHARGCTRSAASRRPSPRPGLSVAATWRQ